MIAPANNYTGMPRMHPPADPRTEAPATTAFRRNLIPLIAAEAKALHETAPTREDAE